jgi:propanediol dehydratase small subunit
MEPVDLGHARARLETLARRARDLLGGSAVFSVAGAVAAAAGRPQLAFSFAFGAALAGALVAQGDAPLIVEAEAFARKLASPPMRLRLARGLERAAEAGRPGVHEYTWVRPERVFDIREELLRLAAGFRDLAVPVAPASAALCRRMLCEAAASPLYNPKIPEVELARLLRVIAAGLEGYRVREFGETT